MKWLVTKDKAMAFADGLAPLPLLRSLSGDEAVELEMGEWKTRSD